MEQRNRLEITSSTSCDLIFRKSVAQTDIKAIGISDSRARLAGLPIHLHLVGENREDAASIPKNLERQAGFLDMVSSWEISIVAMPLSCQYCTRSIEIR